MKGLITTDNVKSLTEIIKNIVLTTAILIGGFWAYHKFDIQTIQFNMKTRPAIVVSTSIESKELANGNKFVNLYVNLENKGNRPKIFPENAYVRLKIYNLSPETSRLMTLEQKNSKVWINFLVDKDYSGENGVFKKLASPEAKMNTNPIESGDSDQYLFTFILPKEIDAIWAYASVILKDKDSEKPTYLEKSVYKIYQLK